MDSRFSNQRVYLLYVATALYVFVDLLLVVPVVVVTLQWPEQIWVALVPYLAVTLGGLALISYAGYRWGVFDFKAPTMTEMLPFLAVTTVLVGAIVVDPGLAWLAVPVYLAAMAYVTYRLVAWQAANLALVCQECGVTFAAGLRTWALSPNMGTRKLVTCPACGVRKRTGRRVSLPYRAWRHVG